MYIEISEAMGYNILSLCGDAIMDIQNYFDYVNAPWGRLFYKLVWDHLQFRDMKILDFGSGFGITAEHLSKDNSVIAIEPNEDMVKLSMNDGSYTQLLGSTEKLKELEDFSFDVIICHNVLEYMGDGRGELIDEFYRILADGGILSIVKHNKLGKVMHKAIFEYNIDEVKKILQGGKAESVNFGVINEYELDELDMLINGKFDVSDIFGIRTFYGLQDNDLKGEVDWVDKMFELERIVEDDPRFYGIAFFQHLLLKKVLR